MSNFILQKFYVIAVTLLSEFAEAGKVLTYLRGSEAHLGTQLAGGDALNIGVDKLVKLAQVSGQAADNIFGYVRFLHVQFPYILKYEQI